MIFVFYKIRVGSNSTRLESSSSSRVRVEFEPTFLVFELARARRFESSRVRAERKLDSARSELQLQLVADFYIKILCSRFCNWLQPGLQPPELQLPSCRANFNMGVILLLLIYYKNKLLIFIMKIDIVILHIFYNMYNIMKIIDFIMIC